MWPICIETEWYCQAMWWLMALADSGGVLIGAGIGVILAAAIWKTFARG
jgi:hypothetical protein